MMPWIESSHTMTPSPVNPLGVKGVGEAGTIGCSPAVVNSVVDALAARRAAHRYAADAGKDLEAHPGRRPSMIPQELRIHRAGRRCRRRSACCRRRRQDSRRRHEPDPADEAAAGRSGTRGGHQPHPRPELTFARRRGAIRIGAMTTHHEIERRRCCARKCPLLAETGGEHRRRAGAQHGHHRRQHRACRSGGGLSGGAVGARGQGPAGERRHRTARSASTSSWWTPSPPRSSPARSCSK